MVTRSQKRPQDVTGKLAEQLAAEHAEQLAEKSRSLSLVTAQVEEDNKHKIVDYSDPAKPIVLDARETGEVDSPYLADPIDMEINVEEVDRVVTVRTNCDLEQVTIGHGTSFDFQMGVRYRVPVHVAEHLGEKGLLWY